MEAYISGDPYLAFAKQVGAVPSDATKKSHPVERGLYKECVLAVQYGMGRKSLALKIGSSPAVASSLLQHFKTNYRTFSKWSDKLLDYIMFHNEYMARLGWQIDIYGTRNVNTRSLLNFPMQANGAEILRVACVDAIESGIKICATVHDALLIEAPLDLLDDHIYRTQQIMQEAGEQLLDGFKLNSDVEVFRWPDRYMDERGAEMWGKISNYLKI